MTGLSSSARASYTLSMSQVSHTTQVELEQSLGWVVASPRDVGVLEMIVVRPSTNQRVPLEQCEVSPAGGLHGDNWATHCRKKLEDGRPDPDVQVTMINARLISLLAEDRERQMMAGDQLYADIDVSEDNLPVGQRLAVGSAVFEVTPEPHTGCVKFSERFGREALKFISVKERRALRLRGIYLKIVSPGAIAQGDIIRKA